MTDSLKEEILRSATTSLINSDVSSDYALRPKIIYNDYKQGKKVVANISAELAKCSRFDFSVAFITKSGLTSLLQVLKETEQRGVQGRILTTDYLAFSDPDALEKLNAFKNIKVRMYQVNHLDDSNGFHTKGYIFEYKTGYKKIIIGSSNLTGSALTTNNEWNIELSMLQDGEIQKNTTEEFERLWNEAEDLDDVINEYRVFRREHQNVLKHYKIVDFEQILLKPNKMQLMFLGNLKRTIENGAKRSLLISATGTGKTYASAFAIQQLKPHRMLFLAHREQVLKQAIKSYKKVIGTNKTIGLLSGSSKNTDSDYLFATMQTMAKDEVLNSFSRKAFDFIIVDEVHRAGSASYQKILDYFEPKFCLGMTATPDRADDFDIYGLFDNEIVYEIRLKQAMENNLLCPFHYFGISDLTINGKDIEDKSEFNCLVSADRVNYILEQAQFYGYSGDRVKGLIFCSRKSEGVRLAEEFNRRGVSTEFISGETEQSKREDAIERLVSNPGQKQYEKKLDYIITVDIFNEGVDIPEVNQVLMLRPTQSPVVFIQQLGRGLRKHENKEYVVIIDFIGNYNNNYMIPIALSGDRTYNKDTIRKFVMEGERIIPGCSSVHFDEVAREKIFRSIDSSTITMRMLKEKYSNLKHKIGRVPKMLDFFKYGEIDPMIIVDKKKSYYRFLSEIDPDYYGCLTEEEQRVLEFVSRYFGNGMRPHELLILKGLIEEQDYSKDRLEKDLVEMQVLNLSANTYNSALGVIDKSFVNTQSDTQTYSNFDILLRKDDGTIECTGDFHNLLKSNYFKDALLDVIEYGLQCYKDKYIENDDGLTLYEKYSRKDVCRLLNWEKDCSSTVYGYRVAYETCPIFVTYNKKDDIASSTQYDDKFISQNLFSWMTRSRLTLESQEVKKIINAEENNIDIRLFIKKSDSEGSEFYYFGKVKPIAYRQTSQRDDKGNLLPIVNFTLELDHPVQDDIYAYFEDSPIATETVA